MLSIAAARPRAHRLLSVATVVVAVLVLAGCTADSTPPTPTSTPAPTASEPGPVTEHSALADEIRAVIAERTAEWGLGAVIVHVAVDGEEVLTEATGDSMTNVPASVDMHFRNGAIAIPLVATTALQLVDEGVLALDATIDRWVPDIPHADQVTVGQLLQMTGGYQDYVRQLPFVDAQQADPYRSWEPEELLAFVADLPLLFEPGTNWAYSHTSYVILGLVLEAATGTPVSDLLNERVLGPAGLDNTADPGSAWMPEPVLHAFTPERAEYFGVTDPQFMEEATYWSPSWTLTRGAIQYTDIRDAAESIALVGRGDLLPPELHELQIAPDLIGKTSPVEGCAYCFEHSVGYSYGFGIVLSGDWVLQNPMFHGYSGASAYLPADDISIAVAVTFTGESFDENRATPNRADDLFRLIGGVVAPDNPPPLPPGLQE